MNPPSIIWRCMFTLLIFSITREYCSICLQYKSILWRFTVKVHCNSVPESERKHYCSLAAVVVFKFLNSAFAALTTEQSYLGFFVLSHLITIYIFWSN